MKRKKLKKITTNQLDYLDQAKGELAGLSENLMVESLKHEWESEKSGMGADISTYLRACEEANSWIKDDPTILDDYAIHIKDDKDDYDPFSGKVLEAVQQVLYFRSNPWILLHRVVGLKKLNRTTVSGNKFTGFFNFQKRYLRDMLDPRIPRMIFTACRGGAKTWLTSMGAFTDEYTNPELKIMIISGSQRQSDNLYTYYSTVSEGTPYMRLIKKGRFLRRKSETIAGGWIESFPASEKRTHGPRPDKVIIDEACKAETPHIMGSISAALTSQTLKLVFASTPDKMVHIFTDYLRDASIQSRMSPGELKEIPKYLRWKKYTLSAFECPWIPEENIKLMTSIYGGVNSHNYKIFILGEPAPAEGAVFDGQCILDRIIEELPEKIMITLPDGEQVEEDIKLHSHTVGMDMGGKHPSAIVKVGEDQMGNTYVHHDEEITQETNTKGEGLEEYVIDRTTQCAKSHSARVFLDAAPIQWYANRKIQYSLSIYHLSASIIPFSKNKMPMISNVRGFLEDSHEPNVYFVRDKSEKLVNQLLEYSYSESKVDDKPEKGNDDHIDAFLLAMWGHRYKFTDKKYNKGSDAIHNMGDLLDSELMDPFKGIY